MDKSEILAQRNPLSDIDAIPKPTDYSSTTPEYYKILNQQNQPAVPNSIPSIPISGINSNPLPNPYTLSSNYDINPTQLRSNYHHDPYFKKSPPHYTPTQFSPSSNYAQAHYTSQTPPFAPPPFQMPSVNYNPIDQNYQSSYPSSLQQRQQQLSSSSSSSPVFGFPYESAQPPKMQSTNHTPLTIRSRWSDIYRELDSFGNIMYLLIFIKYIYRNTLEYSLKSVNTSELGISNCFDKFHESMRKIKIQIQYIQHDIDEVMIHQAGLTEEINYLKIQIVEKQKQYYIYYLYFFL